MTGVTGGRISLRLDLPTGPVDMVLEAPRPEGRYFLSGPRLAVAYRGSHLGPEGLAAVRAVFQRLSDRSFPEVLEAAARIARASPAGTPGPATRDDRDHKPRLATFFKQPDRASEWARLVVPERPYLDSSVVLPPGAVHLQHGTRECLHNDVPISMRSLRLFADAWMMNNPERGRTSFHTDLGEADVLGGTTGERLREALREVSALRRPTLVHVATTCLPELIGDDPAMALEEQRSRSDVLWTAKTRSSGESISTWLARALRDLGPTFDRDPTAVVVAGVAAADNQREIERLLGLLGLRTVGHLLPSLDLAAIPDLARAAAVVFGESAGWAAFGDDVFAPRFLVVRPPSPIGEAATVAWLEAVGRALGVAGIDAATEVVRREFDERLAPLRQEAAGCVVALVGTAKDLEVPLGADFYGFSVARCLGELGFRVRCLVAGDPVSLPVGTPPAPLAAGTIEFVAVDGPDALAAALADCVDVAFSHFSVDPRLAAHGLRSFCQDVFRPGIAGLERAGREVLARARGRWSPSLRRHLGPGGRR